MITPAGFRIVVPNRETGEDMLSIADEDGSAEAEAMLREIVVLLAHAGIDFEIEATLPQAHGFIDRIDPDVVRSMQARIVRMRNGRRAELGLPGGRNG